jgi:triacylglycerol lipase
VSVSHVYLLPGLFGFHRIGSMVYFGHLERAIDARFQGAGRNVAIHVVDLHPGASIRRRARQLLEEIDRTAGDEGPLHLVGHSTGGLDARLLASPTMNVNHRVPRTWRARLRSVTSLDTPHYGTPLASFFTTVNGQRALFAISALTVVALKIGAPPLEIAGSLAAAFGKLDRLSGLGPVERLVDRLAGLLDDASSRDLRLFLAMLRDDQGAMIQLTPEAMDLFEAGVEDDPAIRYHCTVAYAPLHPLRDWARVMASPWGIVSGTLFATLQRLTALESKSYPCAPPGGAADPVLTAAYGTLPPPEANDGVVPLRSQLHGRLIWSGLGDHLDVVGHFRGKRGDTHVDWMRSGAHFDEARFASLCDALVKELLASEIA